MLFFTKDKTRTIDTNRYNFVNLVKNRRGFTLVELSLVLVILGLLVAVAIPVFSDQRSDASRVVCHSRLFDLRTAEEAYYMLHGEHTEEYINETVLHEDSGLLEFFDDDTTITCNQTGEYYFWDTRDGVKMLFCPEHGTVDPAVINDPPPVPVTLTLFMEMAQDYAEDRITYLEFSTKMQNMSMGADLVYGTDEIDLIKGKAGDDLIDGGGGDDKIYGNNNEDGIFGGDGDDYINGGNGNDILTGGSGDDRIIGGNGNDTVVYDKPFSSYTIEKINNTKFYIIDNETGERDRVEKVENFQFGEDDAMTVQDIRNLF